MSKIDEMIAELCPDGVEYKRLGDVCAIKNGKDYKHLPEGSVPVYGSGGYMGVNVAEAAYSKPTVLLPRKGSITNIFYMDKPFWNVDTVFYTVIDLDQVIPRYLYHVLLNAHIENYSTGGAARPSLTQTALNRIEIPIPPLEIQKEIVRILDKFAELEAELEARKAQYAYYRDKLLSQADLELLEGNPIPLKSLSNICSWIGSGGTPNKQHAEYYDEGNIPWLRTQEVKYEDIYEVSGRITPQGLANSSAKMIPVNCVIVAISGATAGRCAVNKIECATNQHCLNMSINPASAHYRYVYHCICSQTHELLSRKEGARGDLSAGRIKSLEIPVPSLETQQKVVDILDRFDTLTTSLTDGLPAEIQARRQQYKYYRDKLLSFPRLNAADL